MKNISSVIFIITMFLLLNSCDNKDGQNTTASATTENTAATTAKPVAVSIPVGMENIVGEWGLVKRLRDDNGNHKIDAEEESTAIPGVESYLKFNADGTCKFETVMDGTYEIITEEDGRKSIAIQDLNGTKYPIKLYINSVTENELVINTVYGGSGFDVFKRK